MTATISDKDATGPAMDTDSIEAFIAMGRVLEAHAGRARARSHALDGKEGQAMAEADHRHFGGFDDCGPSYEAGLQRANALFTGHVAAKVEAERRSKALRHGFAEQFPHLVDDLAERLKRQSRAVAAAHPSNNRR